MDPQTAKRYGESPQKPEYTLSEPNGFSFNALQSVPGFYDVLQSDWFAGDVAYAVNKGLMSGTDTRVFSPNGPMTRGMTVAALYRLEGSPSVSGSCFSDVNVSDWYGPAVQWARTSSAEPAAPS